MDDQGKRVSWVELYLDLVFVLVATFQLARLRPELSPYGYVWLLTDHRLDGDVRRAEHPGVARRRRGRSRALPRP
jgi:hypothetical protein